MPNATPICLTFEASAVNWLAGPDIVYAIHFTPLIFNRDLKMKYS